MSSRTFNEIKEYLRSADFSEEEIRAVKENSTLFETLLTPLFLTMYAKLHDKKDICTQGEIFHTFFNERERSVTDYSESYTQQPHLVEIEGEAKRAEQSPKIDADMQAFMVDFLLPVVGRNMEKKGLFHLHKKNIGDLIWPVLTETDDTAVCGEWGQSAFSKYSEQGDGATHTQAIAEKLLTAFGENKSKFTDFFVTYCSKALGILEENRITKQFGFFHHSIRDYFAAVAVINRLKVGVTAFENGDKETALACVNGELKDDVLGFTVRQFIGEALREHHNRPWCDEEGIWHYNVPDARSKDNATLCDRNLLTRVLNIYRGRFDGEDGYGLWNLIQILKEVRNDLSGEDFSKLDLTDIRLNGYNLGKLGCSSVFSGAIINRHLLRPCGHSDRIYRLSFAPDGKRFLTIGEDGRAIVWDSETLVELAAVKTNTEYVYSAVWSPDGTNIVMTSSHSRAVVRDASTLRRIGILIGHSDVVRHITFSPDGKQILTGADDGTFILWDARTYRHLVKQKRDSGRIFSACFNKDGSNFLILTFSEEEGTAQVWDTATFTETGTLTNLSKDCMSAVFSPDGKQILTVSDQDELTIWDAHTLLSINSTGAQPYHICTVSYSPDSRRIVAATELGKAVLWNSETLREEGVLDRHPLHYDWMLSAEFSPDGTQIATGMMDSKMKSIFTTFWSVETLGELESVKGVVDEFRAGWSPDGTRILTTSFDSVTAWSTGSFRKLGSTERHDRNRSAAAITPDGDQIWTVTGSSATIWDAETYRKIGSFWGAGGAIKSLAISHDGTKVLTVIDANYGEGIVWDIRTHRKIGLYSRDVFSGEFSPDDKRIVSAGFERAFVWDLTSGEPIMYQSNTRSDAQACELAYSPNGLYIAAATDWDGVVLYNADRFQKIHLVGPSTNTYSIAFSPDSRRLVSVSKDNTVIVWDIPGRRMIKSFMGHTDSVLSVSYSKNGHKIATASADKTAKVWDARTFTLLVTLYGHSDDVDKVIWLPDNLRLFTVSCDGIAKIWDTITSECLHSIRIIPGLEILGCDFRNLHQNSKLSDKHKQLLWEYGARFNDEDMPPIPDMKQLIAFIHRMKEQQGERNGFENDKLSSARIRENKYLRLLRSQAVESRERHRHRTDGKRLCRLV